jgi:hypothetical protein
MLFIETSYLLGLDFNYVNVLRTNTHAISFNKSLGYELLPGQDDVENQQYILTERSFFEKTKKLREILQRRWGSIFTCVISDPNEDAAANILAIGAAFDNVQRDKLVITVES